jgi:hypothetical protein
LPVGLPVRLGTAAKAVPFDAALDTAALRRAGHVYQLAALEEVGLDDLPDFQPVK